jgi:hypothetical protein
LLADRHLGEIACADGELPASSSATHVVCRRFPDSRAPAVRFLRRALVDVDELRVGHG